MSLDDPVIAEEAVPHRGAIARGAIAIALTTIVVKAVVFAREMKVASAYGRGDHIDAFLVASLLPMAIGVAIGGSFHQVVTPMLARVRQGQGDEAASRLTLVAAASALALAAGGALALAAAAHWLLPLIASSFAAAKLRESEVLLYALLPLCVTGSLYPLLSAELHSRHRFLLAAAVPVATPLATIVAIRLGSGATAWPLVAGVLAGAAIECAILAIAAAPALADLAIGPIWRGARPVLAQVWPVLGGLAFQLGTTVVDQVVAAHLQPGSVSALSYATRIVGVPMGVAAMALGTATLPVLGALASSRDGRFWSTLRWWQRRTLWGGVAVTLVIMASIQPLVRFGLERGNFTAGDTALVSAMVCAMTGAMPFYVTGILGIKALSALGENRLLVRMAAINLVVDIAANLAVARPFGVLGVAWATTAVYVVSCAQIQLALARVRSRAEPAP